MLTFAVCLSVVIGFVIGFRNAGVRLAAANAPGSLTRICIKGTIGFLVLSIAGVVFLFMSDAAIVLAFGSQTAGYALPMMISFGLLAVVALYFAAYLLAHSASLMHHISTRVQSLP
ncbi:MAG: hypothetical protein SGJ27_24655 [Candidatus Melainabacteria bacterium]|nr:hypothetical protein [Candidatus Melainabacteria bacterium]